MLFLFEVIPYKHDKTGKIRNHLIQHFFITEGSVFSQPQQLTAPIQDTAPPHLVPDSFFFLNFYEL